MPTVPVTRTHLRLGDHRPSRPAPPGFGLRAVSPCPAPLYRRLYADVGGPWHWRDKLAWDDARLDAYLAEPGRRVFLAELDGALAGFVQLDRLADGTEELAYFGLLPAWLGRGLGGPLLDLAIAEAARSAPPAIILNTCTLDHPSALPNYLRRGFVVEREESYAYDIP
ncbi:MAG: GNAT family N-acetyltransferase [Gemmatimonadales bacterium]|nr:GNAT family N-acetyltransferase [Gemmatimonadales bacterium]